MKFAAILILSIIMFSMISHVSATASIADMLRSGEVATVEETGVQTDIVACVQSVYALGRWGYDLFLALKAEDMNQIILLVTKVQGLIVAFTSACFE